MERLGGRRIYLPSNHNTRGHLLFWVVGGGMERTREYPENPWVRRRTCWIIQRPGDDFEPSKRIKRVG